MIVTGYKYNSLNAANGAKNSLKAHYFMNRPNPPQGETWFTTEWVEVTQDPQGFYYFLGDYSPVLGNPTQFNITDVEI